MVFKIKSSKEDPSLTKWISSMVYVTVREFCCNSQLNVEKELILQNSTGISHVINEMSDPKVDIVVFCCDIHGKSLQTAGILCLLTEY